MEGELKNLTTVWLTVISSLTYCFFLSKTTSKGKIRFILVLPIIILFFILPLHLTSMHLGSITAFFIAWLGTFKLLLFSFGQGPLSSSTSSSSLIRFIAVGSLPIKIQQNPNQLASETQQNQKPHPSLFSFLNYVIRVLLLVGLIRVYDYSDYIYPKFVLVLYCFHIYLLLDLILAIAATLARNLLGAELEKQFNEPYYSSSLQDFWGRRWNLMVTRILRPTVYLPVLETSSRFLGSDMAQLTAVMMTFVVSGLMHELMFFYMGQGKLIPSWEVTLFFIIHGTALVVELGLKRTSLGSLRLPVVVSATLTNGFVMVTGFWLFFPQFLRRKVDVRAFEEYNAIGEFVKNLSVSVSDYVKHVV